MGFRSISELVGSSYEQGKTWYSSFRKTPAIASTQGSFIDLSIAPGSPKANYYVGDVLTATNMHDVELDTHGYTNIRGIWHGGNVSPATKHLHKIVLNANNAGVVPAKFIIADYLMFYPLIDMDSTDEQVLDNTLATLPRYVNGVGVQAFLVAGNPYIGGSSFTMTYVNQFDQTHMTPPITTNTNTTIGTLVHSGIGAGTSGAFIRLAPGDFIKSATSITFLAANGGTATLVLCYPMATGFLREVTAPAEWDLMVMKPELPRVYDGAFLSFLCAPNGSVAAQGIFGSVEVVWN